MKDINNKLEKMIKSDRASNSNNEESNDSLRLENELRNLIYKNFKIKNLFTNLKKIRINDTEKYEIKIEFVTENKGK